MKALTNSINRFSVFLAISIVILLCLNFTILHNLTDLSRIRFITSGLILGMVALFFRFALPEITPLYRAFYRIAVTIMIWSFGLSLFPYPSLFLYLIFIPALYFAYRIEVKAVKNALITEDQVAEGILLSIVACLYFEQQPIQMFFFPETAFNWLSYYTNAPLLVLTGLGMMRLQKMSNWKGLCILGSCFFLIGLVLTSTFFLKKLTQPEVPWELILLLFYAHAGLAFLYFKNKHLILFKDFCGLKDEEFRHFSLQFFYIANACLQGALLTVLLKYNTGYWGLPFVLIANMGLLFAPKPFFLSWFIIETGCLLFPGATLYFSSFHPDVISSLLALLLVLLIFLRRKVRIDIKHFNIVFFVSALLFTGSLFVTDFFIPYKLVYFAILFFCYTALPDKPVKIPSKTQLLVWPGLTVAILLYLKGGFSISIFNLWGMLCIYPPVLLFLLTRNSQIQNLIIKYNLNFINDWLSSKVFSILTWISVIIGIIGFLLNYDQYMINWKEGFYFLTILLAGIGINLYLTTVLRGVSYAILTEILIGITLVFLRWEIGLLEGFNELTALDGYLLMGFAFIASGIREVIRKRIDTFNTFLYKSSLFWGIAGWCYLVYEGWINERTFSGEIASLLLAGLYFLYSKTRNKIDLIPTFIFVNIAILLSFFHMNLTNLQFYIIPTAGSALVLAQLFKNNIKPAHLTNIRFICSIMCVGVSSGYNMIDFNASVFYPLAAAIVSALAVIFGISLRIRIYLYLGLSFFFLNSIAVVVHVILNQPPSHYKLLIGIIFLITGILFTGSFIIVQMKRQQILEQYARLKSELKSWE